MRIKIRNLKKLFAGLLAFVLLFSVALPCYAEPGGNVQLSNNGFIPFGNFGGTNDADLTIDGQIAYCLNPEMHAPDSGVYPASFYSVTDQSLLVNVLYYGYGGPGDITGEYGLSAAERHVLTHLAAAKAFGGNWTYTVSEWGINMINRFVGDVQNRPTVAGTVLVFCQYEGGQHVGQLVSYIPPQPPKGYLRLVKSSALPQITDGNRCYSLAGAGYAVYEDAACTQQAADLPPTDETGRTGPIALDPGHYWIRETAPAKGYELDTQAYPVDVEAGHTEDAPLRVAVSDMPKNDPVTILVAKVDAETGKAEKRLQGAQFTVCYYDAENADEIPGLTPKMTWVFETDENGLIDLEEAYKVSGDALYTTAEGRAVLPLGYITIQETKAPEGYLPDSAVYCCATDEINGVVVTSDLPVGEIAVKEQRIRGDIEFTKVSGRTEEALAGVPFRIVSGETGESITVVTDENGYATTADGSGKGTLLPGSYLVEEQPCEANYGLDLVSFTVYVTLDQPFVNKGTIRNLPIEIATSALSTSTGTQNVPAAEEEEIIDRVSFQNLTSGRAYVMKGSIVDSETEEILAEAEMPFQPEEAQGEIALSFSVSTKELEGHTLVVLEELYSDGVLRADHTDRMDEKQMIFVPEIGTKAVSEKTGNAVLPAEKECVLQDTVSYKGLVPGDTYTLTGVLMDRETGEPLLEDGKEITAEETFVPEQPEGSAVVSFRFDTSLLGGKTIVAFETLKKEEVQLCVHADLEDEAQTVFVPGIKTSAKDRETGTRTGTVSENAVIVDTVSYQNLVPGVAYKVKGILVDKATGKPVVISGREITAEQTFVPEQNSGTVEMSYSLNSRWLQGRTTVVFEELYYEDVQVCAHADLSDEKQTVSYPKLPERPKTSRAPRTGDSVQTAVWIGTAAAAAAVLSVLLAVRKRRNRK